MVSSQQYHYKIADAWFKELYYCHGYSALRLQHVTNDLLAVLMRYPTNMSVVENAVGMIVHSQHSIELGSRWAKSHAPHRWHVIPHLRAPVLAIDRAAARARLGLDQDSLIVSSFGFVSPTKQSLRIAKAWLASPLAKQANAKLVFVGANNPGDYGEEMLALMKQSEAEDSISISGWADHGTFRDYLAASDLAVQLRTMSRGETSGSVLDAMNYELATIVNKHGSMGDLPNDAVFMLPDEFTDEELTDALTRLSRDADLRSAIGSRAKLVIEEDHSPFRCAEAYRAAIEASYGQSSATLHSVLKKLRSLRPETWPSTDLAQVALAAEAATTRMSPTSYLDVTNALTSDAERYDNSVFANFVSELFAEDLPRRLEPIYFDFDSEEWRYARKATLRAIQISVPSLADNRVIFAPSSDVFRFAEGEGGPTGRSAGSDRLTVVREWTLSRRDEQTMDGPDNHPLGLTFRKLGYLVTTQTQKSKNQ
jgi:glycosyltransferase involved in cell wall biosynthesis